MLIYVYGGSGSGKSAFAESLVVSLGNERVYLATMYVGERDGEGQRRVQRHRRLREGKGFFTIEQEREIGSLSDRISLSKASVLLEDLPNLLANEMFSASRFQGEEKGELSGKSPGQKKEPSLWGGGSVAFEGRKGEGRAGQEENIFSGDLARRIYEDLLSLSHSCENLVLVGGEIFSDGLRFEGDMRDYLRALGEISQGLCKRADWVYEVVYGIPLCKKAGGKK